MHVRAISMALPLVVGIACSTTHSRSNPSAHTATAASGQTDGNVTTSEPKTAAESSTSPTSPSDQTASSSSGQAQGSVTTSEPRSSAGSDTSPSASASTPSGTDTSSSASASSSPSASSSDVTRDPLMEPGDAVQGHADDTVVSGTIARVSRRTLVIDSDAGEQKTLFLAPETSIEVDGQDAHRSDLQEGQDVRASFNEVNGRDIAVKVRVGEGSSSSSDQGGSSATPESGSEGSSWERGPGGTGTPSEPGNSSPGDTSGSGSSRQGY